MRLVPAAVAASILFGACSGGEPAPVVQSCTAHYNALPDAKYGLLAYYAAGAYPLLINDQLDSSEISGSNTWMWKCGWQHVFGPDSQPSGYAMAYDPALRQTVLVGQRTMAWNGSGWVDLGAKPPLNLGSTSMVFDAARGVMVLVDSYASGVNTWTYDGRAWTKVSTSGPQDEAGAGVAYDPRTKAVILFGGLASAGHGAQQVTWSWNGSSWTLLQPDTSPPGAQAVMGYDEATRQMILLTQDQATWEWDGTNWKELQIASPPFGAYIGLIYDSAHQYLFLWAGGPDYQKGSQTWTYTGTWAQQLQAA